MTSPEGRVPRDGFLIHQAAVYGQYYSTGLSDSFGAVLPTQAALRSDLALGGAASFGYLRLAERTQFSLSYGSSYVGRTRYSELNALNHALDLRVDHRLTPLTRFGLSVNSNISTTEAFAFVPPEGTLLASVDGDAVDLSRAVSGQQIGDAYLASRLDGVHDADSALRLLLFGNRVLNSSANVSLVHSISPRLTFTTGAGIVRRQQWRGSEGADAQRSLLPHMTSGSASAGLSYSLSPRTQIGFGIESARGRSELQDNYATSSQISFQRMMGQRWFVGLSGGIGVVKLTRQMEVPNTTRPSYVAGGSLGYRANSHTFMFLYDRTISNTYGTAATASQGTSATWQRRAPGGQWLWSASGMRQELTGGIVPITSWRGLAELRRNVGRNAQLSVQYSYMTFSQPIPASPLNLRLNGLRVALIWSPQN